MAFYEWAPHLSVGIESIDRQHKTLIGYINSLAEGLVNGNASHLMGTTLSNLVNYTKMHFLYEEMLFDRHGYPQHEEHKAFHARLINHVATFKTRYDSGDKSFGPELLEFLKSWLNDHILTEDRGYSAFLIKQGVS